MTQFITGSERKKLFARLHHHLFWAGQLIPYEIEIDGEKIELHELVWQLLNKKELSDTDHDHIDHLISLLSKREKQDEAKLKEMDLTPQEATVLFDETAALLRTIMDLKEIESGEDKDRRGRFDHRTVQKRVDDAKNWANFLKDVKS
ncbi:DUF5788 family protein [Methanococcoides sp. FTZ1]|uniref:DUF5788 family protein n=1 Tax=Methanococcoides sp. FTZ1 TaxID=3439061 RepID=UPI003F84644B